MNFLNCTSSSSNVVFFNKISLFLSITSLSSFKFGKILLILFSIIEGLSDFPSASDDTYDKYSFSSAVVNALYILKLSSYNCSSVPFASSIPHFLRFSLSLSFKNPSFL